LVVGLTIFFDPALHGTVAHPALDGMEARHRALMVRERSKAGILLDPALSPAKLLMESAKQAHVTTPASAAIFSLEAVTSETRLLISTAPRSERGPAVRPAGVAGKFYPDNAEELTRLVDGFLNRKLKGKAWPAAMVPHAGLRHHGGRPGLPF